MGRPRWCAIGVVGRHAIKAKAGAHSILQATHGMLTQHTGYGTIRGVHTGVPGQGRLGGGPGPQQASSRGRGGRQGGRSPQLWQQAVSEWLEA